MATERQRMAINGCQRRITSPQQFQWLQTVVNRNETKTPMQLQRILVQMLQIDPCRRQQLSFFLSRLAFIYSRLFGFIPIHSPAISRFIFQMHWRSYHLRLFGCVRRLLPVAAAATQRHVIKSPRGPQHLRDQSAKSFQSIKEPTGRRMAPNNHRYPPRSNPQAALQDRRIAGSQDFFGKPGTRVGNINQRLGGSEPGSWATL